MINMQFYYVTMNKKEIDNMKAILVNDDRSLRWDDVPNPEIKSEEVLVEIHAAALNRADLMQREGDYPPPPGCPEWNTETEKPP